jgi:hypothetical protein
LPVSTTAVSVAQGLSIKARISSSDIFLSRGTVMSGPEVSFTWTL